MKDQNPAAESEQDQESEQPELIQGRGRPVEREWPEPIPDTPENLARALMAGPPKAEETGDTSRSTGTESGKMTGRPRGNPMYSSIGDCPLL